MNKKLKAIIRIAITIVVSAWMIHLERPIDEQFLRSEI